MLIDLVPPGPLLQIINGDLVYYDDTRSTWLTSSSSTVTFGLNHRNISSNRYMKMTSGVYSNISGYRVSKNSVITSISIQSLNIADCIFRIRKNNNPTNIVSLSLTSQNGNSINSLNININKNEFIQCYMEVNSGNIDFPELTLNYSGRQ